MYAQNLHQHPRTFIRGRALLLVIVLAVALLTVTGFTFSARPPSPPANHDSNGDALATQANATGEETCPPMPGPSLLEAYKFASKPFLAPGEVLTYTVFLHNGSITDVVATVTDPVPTPMTYIPDSATENGIYYTDTATLSWSAVTVSAKSNVSLSFAVTAPLNSMTPTLVTNVATITVGNLALHRDAVVRLMPPAPPVYDLAGSYKSASKRTLAPGEVLTYTIYLRNRGITDVVAGVTDLVPQVLTYISGTLTGDGVFDPDAKTLTWNGVKIPAGGSVPLSFAVTTAADVMTPIRVINTAAITVSGTSFERETWVLLVPRESPVHHLYGSQKSASKYIVGPGEVLTYTIHLHNSGNSDVLADVMDPVPAPMTYLSGTATGGDYQADTATLSWSAVRVPAGDGVSLSFAVTAPLSVTTPTRVTNVATITVGSDSFPRKARVLIMPQPVNLDTTPPVVHSLTIDDQDVLTSPTVTLHISATDNVAVRWMYLREWSLKTTPWPHWQVTHSTGWLTYQADYTWTLESQSGTHFVGVWVADEAFNISKTDRRAFDFASLLLPGATVRKFGLVPYLVHYEAGVEVSAVLTSTTGDADLYVWYPGRFGRPDRWRTQPLTATDVVSFTTPRAGTYLFLVHGYTDTTYDLSITPGGGPHAWPMAAMSISETDQATPGKPDELTSEPVLTVSGLDPLDSAAAPSEPTTIYLPLVMR